MNIAIAGSMSVMRVARRQRPEALGHPVSMFIYLFCCIHINNVASCPVSNQKHCYHKRY